MGQPDCLGAITKRWAVFYDSPPWIIGIFSKQFQSSKEDVS